MNSLLYPYSSTSLKGNERGIYSDSSRLTWAKAGSPVRREPQGDGVPHEREICDDKRYLTLNTVELLPNMRDKHHAWSLNEALLSLPLHWNGLPKSCRRAF